MEFKKVHEDRRGKIFTITDDEMRELTILCTNKDFARGGCLHRKNKEFCLVIKGKIGFQKGSDAFILTEGDSLLIGKSIPHCFKSLTDSVVLEWGVTLDDKQEKDPDMLKVVNEINDKAERDINRP
jgi:mannose-6-phosphate isomerase-like protein (cupin superfamily)